MIGTGFLLVLMFNVAVAILFWIGTLAADLVSWTRWRRAVRADRRSRVVPTARVVRSATRFRGST